MVALIADSSLPTSFSSRHGHAPSAEALRHRGDLAQREQCCHVDPHTSTCQAADEVARREDLERDVAVVKPDPTARSARWAARTTSLSSAVVVAAGFSTSTHTAISVGSAETLIASRRR